MNVIIVLIVALIIMMIMMIVFSLVVISTALKKKNIRLNLFAFKFKTGKNKKTIVDNHQTNQEKTQDTDNLEANENPPIIAVPVGEKENPQIDDQKVDELQEEI